MFKGEGNSVEQPILLSLPTLQTRNRAESVSDYDVKLLLNNLNSANSASQSESESELEYEFDVRLSQSYEKYLQETKDQNKSTSTISPGKEEESNTNKRGSKEWWLELKDALEKEAVDKNLTNEIIGGPVSGNRRRTGSWLESISNKPINTGHQRVRSPSPHHNRKPSSEVGNLIQIETQGRPTAASMDPILSTSMTDWWGQLKKGLEDEEPVPVKDKTMENKPVADNIKPEKLEKPPPSTTMDSVKMETPRSHSRNNSRSTSKSRVLRFDNGVYRGDTILSSDGNLLAHGVGCFTASNGEIYLGQWVNGKRTGKGYKTWQDGKEYIGSWVANRRSGHGVITWPSGDVYSGELSYGFQQGKGMLKSSNGDTYIGEWTVNEKQGYGVLYYATGDVFSGEWKHNKKDGPGIYKFAAGQTKIGEWKDNTFIPSEEKKEKKRIKKTYNIINWKREFKKFSWKRIQIYQFTINEEF